MFFLLKLLFFPIWLLLKIISELIEHSGRGHRSRRNRSGHTRTNGRGCLAVAAVVVVIAVIGAIANSCGSAAPTAGHKPAPGASVSPTPSASTVAHPARHRPRRKHHHHHHAAAVPVPTQSAPSCYPLSNGGRCYEPGEFCRYSDAGTTGVAGDGERIKCEDNNGWRWEPI
jgi:hypothetical protein